MMVTGALKVLKEHLDTWALEEFDALYVSDSYVLFAETKLVL